jgi:hypothetical protein
VQTLQGAEVIEHDLCDLAGCPALANRSIFLGNGKHFFACQPHADEIARLIGELLQDQARHTYVAAPLPELREPQVYFARSAVTGLVKIGQSRQPDLRVKGLATAAGPLEIIHTEPGGTDREAILHEMFAPDRQHGEWFKDSEAIRMYVEGACL